MVPVMTDWLAVMSHPDGEIAFFNDAAMGIAPTGAQLRGYAARLGIALDEAGDLRRVHLADSGFFRMQRGAITVLGDVGSVGPAYQPGHAHAGTLSFEMSVGKQRLFVNSGTSCYGTGQERRRQRQTAAHNTLWIDGLDSSEVWGGHRVARRARVLDATMETDSKRSVFRACHDGYARFHRLGMHYRTWTLKDKVLVIEDMLEGDGVHEVRIAFHLHPDIRASFIADEKVILHDQNDKAIARVSVSKPMEFELHDSTYHPEFGMTVPNQRLCIRCVDALPVEIKTRIEVL